MGVISPNGSNKLAIVLKIALFLTLFSFVNSAKCDSLKLSTSVSLFHGTPSTLASLASSVVSFPVVDLAKDSSSSPCIRLSSQLTASEISCCRIAFITSDELEHHFLRLKPPFCINLFYFSYNSIASLIVWLPEFMSSAYKELMSLLHFSGSSAANFQYVS